MEKDNLTMAVETIDSLIGEVRNPGSFDLIDQDEFSVSLEAVKQLILNSKN